MATPLGNLGDLSPRAADALKEADFIVAEDTSVTARLLSALGVKKSILRLNEHSPKARFAEVLDRVAGGETAAVVSDAGTPGISDPGAEIVDLAYERGIEPDSIPGPSAVSNALALSGFFAQRYVFLGYLPRKPNPAKEELAKFSSSTMPIVLFERPSRIRNLLGWIVEALGDRRVALCREMTKMHQEVIRGKACEVLNVEMSPKGEVTVVVEGVRRRVQEGAGICYNSLYDQGRRPRSARRGNGVTR